MAVKFTPNGALDIATDSLDLPEEVKDNQVISGAMLRCTNLTLNKMGLASTRKGSKPVNQTTYSDAVGTLSTSPLPVTGISRLVEMGGVRYEFTDTNIYRNETSLASILSYANWSTCLYQPYNVTTQAIYALNGTDRKKVEDATVYEWGITPPAVAPVVTGQDIFAYATPADLEQMTAAGQVGWQFTLDAVGGASVTFQHEADLIANNESTYPETRSQVETYNFEGQDAYSVYGKYEVVYTYARYVGGVLVAESNPSPAAYTQIQSQLKVTWVESSDTQVTHVRIYRSLIDTAGSWYFVGTYAMANLAAVISLRDDELGAQVDINHDRPPLGTQVIGPSFGGQLFIIKDNLLHYCLPAQPEYWPANYYSEITPPQFPLMAGCFFGGNLFLASEHEIFLVSGTSAASYFAQPMSAVTGTRARNCFLSAKGYGIFHLGTDGIYLYTSAKDSCITDSRFRPIFEGHTTGSIPGWNKDQITNCLMIIWENRLWFGYPSGGNHYPKDFLILDLETNRTVHYQFPFYVRAMTVDYQNKRLLGGATNGYVYYLEHPEMYDDYGTVISWDIQSKEFVQFQKYFPRYARWDVNLGWQAAATGELLIEGELKQTHEITVSRQTRKRHIATCAGKRLSARIHGTGPVDIYGVEVE